MKRASHTLLMQIEIRDNLEEFKEYIRCVLPGIVNG